MEKDQQISFETGVLAKQKNFYQIGTSTFRVIGSPETIRMVTGKKTNEELKEIYDSKEELVIIPTQTYLQKWLREKHFTIVEPRYNYNYNYWNLLIYTPQRETKIWHFPKEAVYSSYEEALEEGLKEALNLIK